MTVYNIVSIDLGASSGRVMLAKYYLPKDSTASGKLFLQQIHRFSNILCQQAAHCCWDLVDLEKNLPKFWLKYCQWVAENRVSAANSWSRWANALASRQWPMR